MSKELFNKLSDLATRIDGLKEQTQTEEATKMSFIVPFFAALGYDVFNPLEFVPEYNADVGTKKGEKVDYAIIKDGEPIILIEAKHWAENLDNHINQLYRYFSVTSAKFGILTNGIEYRFYTDLEQVNVMDLKPFLVLNMLSLKENAVNQLDKFTKETFNVDEILTTAEELMYTNSISSYIGSLYTNPSDDFVRFVLKECYAGQRNQTVVDKFAPIVKKAFNLVVNDLINDKLKTAFEGNAPRVEVAATIENIPTQTSDDTPQDENVKVSKIVTTDDELQAYYIIKGILASITDVENITYKDTESYFGILFKNNTRKWICRVKFAAKDTTITLSVPDGTSEKKYRVNNLNDLYTYRDVIIESCSRFVD